MGALETVTKKSERSTPIDDHLVGLADICTHSKLSENTILRHHRKGDPPFPMWKLLNEGKWISSKKKISEWFVIMAAKK